VREDAETDQGTKKPAGGDPAGLSGVYLNCFSWALAAFRESGEAGVDGVFTKLLLDAEELIVFSQAIGAAQGAGFDLATVGGDGDVGNGRVFGFTGAMAQDSSVAIGLGQLDGVEGFGEGTDLVDFHQDGVGGAGVDAFLEELDVGDEEVIANELYFTAEFFSQGLPVFPITFGAAVFDADDGVFGAEFDVEIDEFFATDGFAGALLEGVGAVLVVEL